MKSAPALLIALVLTAACAAQPSTEAVFGQAQAQTVRDRSQALTAAINAGSVDQIVGFFNGDSVLLPAQAPTVRGRDAIQAYYQDFLAQGALSLESQTTDVGGHGPLAYETGSYTLTRTAEDGASTRDRGKYVFVWRDRNGQWTIDYTIWASDLAEPVQISAATN
ncbi:MAG: DUF4440 domain-containing protein [Vicinamibacterales bacterium]